MPRIEYENDRTAAMLNWWISISLAGLSIVNTIVCWYIPIEYWQTHREPFWDTMKTRMKHTRYMILTTFYLIRIECMRVLCWIFVFGHINHLVCWFLFVSDVLYKVYPLFFLHCHWILGDRMGNQHTSYQNEFLVIYIWWIDWKIDLTYWMEGLHYLQ